jgi:hypothetical protein
VCAILETIGTIHFYFGRLALDRVKERRERQHYDEPDQTINNFGLSSRNYVVRDVFIVFISVDSSFDLQ